MDTVTIKMGEIFASDDPVIMETHGVGSCVVIVLCDEQAGVGGMAHAMLSAANASKTQIFSHPLRYVEEAAERLLNECVKLGAKKEHIKAKLIGGAQMFSQYAGRTNAIGPTNVQAAKNVLKMLGIKIEDEDTGGKTGRNVRFDMSKGMCDVSSKM